VWRKENGHAGEIAYFLCKFFHLPAAAGRDYNALSAVRHAGRGIWRGGGGDSRPAVGRDDDGR